MRPVSIPPVKATMWVPLCSTRPLPTAPPPVTTSQVLEKQREAQDRQAQAALQREQVELNREQIEELSQAPTAAQLQIIRRQATERKALEEQRTKENQRMQAQLQRRFAKAGGDTTQVQHPSAKGLNVKRANGK